MAFFLDDFASLLSRNKRRLLTFSPFPRSALKINKAENMAEIVSCGGQGQRWVATYEHTSAIGATFGHWAGQRHRRGSYGNLMSKRDDNTYDV